MIESVIKDIVNRIAQYCRNSCCDDMFDVYRYKVVWECYADENGYDPDWVGKIILDKTNAKSYTLIGIKDTLKKENYKLVLKDKSGDIQLESLSYIKNFALVTSSNPKEKKQKEKIISKEINIGRDWVVR